MPLDRCQSCRWPEGGQCPGQDARHLCRPASRPRVAALMPPTPPLTALSTPLDEWSYVTEERLLADTRILAAGLPPGIEAVIGISRSGMLVAPLIATWIHRPLLAVSRQAGLSDPGHGARMTGSTLPLVKCSGRVLLLDDTSASGTEMDACHRIVREAMPDAEIVRAVVYCHPRAAGSVDLCVRAYPGLHYLAWNWPNAGHGQLCGYDFDGILCRDFTHEECRSVESYRDAMRCIAPGFLPRRASIPLVVTARHVCFEEETRRWLGVHGLRVDRLLMRNWGEPSADVGDIGKVIRFKAEAYQTSLCKLFAESDPRQAEEIARIARMPVICPAAARVYPGRLAPAATMKYLKLARECPDRGCKVGCQKSLCNRFHREVYLSDCVECIRKDREDSAWQAEAATP